MFGAAMQQQTLDHKVNAPPGDGISSIALSSTNLLLAGSWDNSIRCWQIQRQGNQLVTQPAAQAAHDGPVLSCCFSADGTQAFSGGADNTVRLWQLGQPTPQRIGSHDAPVSCVKFCALHNMVVSGSWDKTVRFWDVRQPREVFKLPYADKVFALDVRDQIMVVSSAESAPPTPTDPHAHPLVHLYNIAQSPVLYNNTLIQSLLKNQTRCICLFPQSLGYAVGSIEGRVEIKDLEDRTTKKSFAFKCHRVKDPVKAQQMRKSEYSVVYPVNGISWHPRGPFATVGADGVYNFWNKDLKQRLKEFKPGEGCRAGQQATPISDACFSPQGDLFAYAASYDWHKGRQFNQGPNDIYIHIVDQSELVAPASKKK